MGKVSVEKVVHGIFGNCVKLQNGIVELLVTTDYGPRVIHYSCVGMENVLYQDLDKSTLGESFEMFNGETIKLYGGHRLWIAPEILPRCYYPDSKPVQCVEIGNGMEFVAPEETGIHIQKSISITLTEDSPLVTLQHGIKNCSVWDIEVSPWCITMMTDGAFEVIPMAKRATAPLPNRNFSLWDYSEMNDQRVYFGKDYIMLKHDKVIKPPFKLGLNNEAGFAAVFAKSQLFIKFFEPVVDGLYPDGGCSYETYVNGSILESESLGELALVAPDEWVTYTEEWELYKEEFDLNFMGKNHEEKCKIEAEVVQTISKYVEI